MGQTRKEYYCECQDPPVDLLRGKHERACPMTNWREVQDEIADVTTKGPPRRQVAEALVPE